MNQDTVVANPVLAAIRSRRGLAGKLGEHLGISRAAVWMWNRVPAEHALSVAKFMKLHPHEVRSDLYRPPRRAKGRASTAAGDG